MSGQPPTFTFSNVLVALPKKVSGIEDDWQEVDWVALAKGEVRVDGDTFALVFRPVDASGKAVPPKPLGCLTGASPATSSDETEGGQTLSVSTSDALHRHYRFTFQSVANANEFQRLGRAATAARAASSQRDDEVQGSCSTAELEERVSERLRARVPIVFGGAELYGPDPNGDSGSEVLLGRGVLAILDPQPDDKRVGSYEVHFHGLDEGAEEAVWKMNIGPRTALQQATVDRVAGEGPMAAWDVLEATGVRHQLTFDSLNVSEAFARDFRVRQRLMAVSLKVSGKQRAVDEVKGELADLRSRSLGARIARFATCAAVVAALLFVVRLVVSSQVNPSKTMAQHAEVALRDGLKIFSTGSQAVGTVLREACEWSVGAIQVGAVEHCAKQPDLKKVQRCLKGLVV